MGDRESLLQKLDTAREAMRALAADIDCQQEIYPGWTIKHVLAHLAGWDDATIASLQAHINGEEAGTPAALGIDHYNAQSVATREALSYDQVIREWELAREQLKTLIRQMPEEKFREPLLFPWGQRGTVEFLVTIFADHELEHATEIRRQIARATQADSGAG